MTSRTVVPSKVIHSGSFYFYKAVGNFGVITARIQTAHPIIILTYDQPRGLSRKFNPENVGISHAGLTVRRIHAEIAGRVKDPFNIQ